MANICKYIKKQKQVSLDSGATWNNVTPAEYEMGDLYEPSSMDCMSMLLQRWVDIPNGYVCEEKNKYGLQIGQYSIDNGMSWENYYPSEYKRGALLETNSDICDNKWEGHYYLARTDGCPWHYAWVEGRGCVYINANLDPIKYVRCSQASSTTLTRSEVAYSPYILFEGYVGDCVTEIAADAFYNSDSLSALTIGSGVTSIETGVFSGCPNLEIVVVDWQNYIFDDLGCNGIFYFENANSSVLLAGCKSTVIPKPEDTYVPPIRKIANYAFSHSTLTSINIPDSVRNIGTKAFYWCTNMTSLIIGTGITNIGDGAFRDCTNLASITIKATTPPTLGTYALYDTGSCPIYVPAASVDTYKAAEGWSGSLASRIQPIT